MKIVIGSDHGGYILKEAIADKLKAMGIEYDDFGTYSEDSCDYPDYALPVCEGIINGNYERGILLCGTGIGISIAANKVKGIRAATVCNKFTAEATAAHNDANVLCMGGRVITPEQAAHYTEIWLSTVFQGGRHKNRIDKIKAIENKYMK